MTLSRRKRTVLAVAAAVAGFVTRARADEGAGDMGTPAIVAGPSSCPSPADVAQRLGGLIPRDTTFVGVRPPAVGTAPVEIVDLGPAVRVSVGERSREYPDPARDCAKRAQFAAVFAALVLRNTAAAAAPPAVLAPPPSSVPAPPLAPRARLDLGATAGIDFGSGQTTVAPGATFRVAVGRRRLVPVVGVGGLLPVDGTLDGVSIRKWEAVVDAGVRAPLRTRGRASPYVELGGAAAFVIMRPLNLAVARSQTTYAFGPRAAAGLIFGASRLAAFVLVAATWFPSPPSISALPNGVLGHTPAFTVAASAGASWGWR